MNAERLIMKYITLILTMLVLVPLAAGAKVIVEAPEKCIQCGMDRTIFAQSRMLISYSDGTCAGVCSIHCAVTEMQQNGNKLVNSLLAADYSTYKLIDSRTANWVIGGSMSGVMTSEAKWAFADMKDAQRFVKENGGMIRSFNQALDAASKEVIAQADEALAVERELKRELR
jgi:hypothetical protein